MSYNTDILDRLVALEIEAMTSVGVTCDAKPYFMFTGEAFPYWTNRLADNVVTDDGSEIEDINSMTFIARIVVGHVQSGVKGEREDSLYEWLPVVGAWINNRELLQSAAYPTRMSNLVRGRVLNKGGFRIFDNAGVGVQQIGGELQIQVIYEELVTQVYLGD